SQLKDEVSQAANALTELGVKTGDPVLIYMPMIPETVVAMLACARIGALHSVVVGGLSASAIRDRCNDLEAKYVITADGSYRRGSPSSLKPAVDQALTQAPSVQPVLVVDRTGQHVDRPEGRDLRRADTVGKASTQHTPEA